MKRLFPLFFWISIALNAAKPQPYVRSSFVSAQEARKIIVLHFFAPWCPSCKAQRPIVNKLMSSDDYREVQAFEVDYDNAQALKKELRVNRQSTLVIFNGKNEVARKAGITTKEQIADFFKSSVPEK